jgi:hypothetical protein
MTTKKYNYFISFTFRRSNPILGESSQIEFGNLYYYEHEDVTTKNIFEFLQSVKEFVNGLYDYPKDTITIINFIKLN